jgi:hypothetical protein
MKIYIDSEFKCHAANDGTFRDVETDFFDGKCSEFIEGFCYDDSKGYVTIYPWKDYSELAESQREYELEKLAEYEALIDKLYAEVTDE